MFSCTGVPDRSASNISGLPETKEEHTELRAAIKKIEPFFEPMGEPEAYDWLGSHNEPGQTFDEYVNSDPTKPTKERRKIYVLPLGSFTPKQKEVIDITTDYLGFFFDLPVQQLKTGTIPKTLTPKDTRFNQYLRARQVRTGFIIDTILRPNLPADAAALIALTNDDLFPDESMSFVFGQSTLDGRVGVWSLRRLQLVADYDTFLQRTLKIAAHETGHMFSMRHCTKYECVFSGTNHMNETDRRPLDACPECTAKICWLSDISFADRYERLAKFARKIGQAEIERDFERKRKAVAR